MNAIAIRFKAINWNDIPAFFILGVTAACGLMYEFMLSSYAARVLGSTEKVIFTVMLLMLCAMGVGAATLPRMVKNHYNAFAIIESLIAIMGSLSLIIISLSNGIGFVLPSIMAETFGIPAAEIGGHGLINNISAMLSYTPYVVAIIIGLFVGAEIPIMSVIRQLGTDEKLKNNMGTMYGVDYLGAFIGGMIWLYVLNQFVIIYSSVIVALANVMIGLLFIFIYRKKITAWKTIVALNILSILCLSMVFTYGTETTKWARQLLYQDPIIFSSKSDSQNFLITERKFDDEPAEIRFYINGSTQFSSADEAIYHSMLVTPAMLASGFLLKPNEKFDVLVIGGGDGLAVRNILDWNPDSVTLLDLDGKVIDFFTNPIVENGKVLNKAVLDLNKFSFQDPRVEIKLGDAFLSADKLIQERKQYDVIIIDLPDPNHPDLTKLYSTVFYDKINFLLKDEGVVAIQSTSPYSAKETFQCVKKTMEAHSFSTVEQYHVNVPSFGEWGFTIARKDGVSPKKLISKASEVYPDDAFSTKALIEGSFHFGKNFYRDYDKIKVNYIDTIVIFDYHEKNWEKMTGTYRTDGNG